MNEYTIREDELSRRTGFPIETLRHFRKKALLTWYRPPGTKHVLYNWAEVKAWIDSGRVKAVDNANTWQGSLR